MTLIPATLADAQDIFYAIHTNRDSLRTWLPFVDDTQTVEDSIAFLKYTETSGEKLFIIRHEGVFAGLIGLKSIDNTNRKTEIGYWIIPAMEGKGLVTHSCQQLIEMAFDELGLNRVLIQVAIGNEKSRKIPIRLGFKEEGVERDGELLVSGYTDIVKYGLLKGDIIRGTEIILKPLQSEDIPLFEKWLDKEYIYKRLCPDGEEQRSAWLDEVSNKDGQYNFLSHFIVYHNDRRIGYCLYADCFFLKNLEEESHDFDGLYGDITESNHTFEIGYLIGEEEYLNKGISKIVIQQLEEKIVALGGREISADPSEDNIFSIKALLSNGFKKKNDGDYRKTLRTEKEKMLAGEYYNAGDSKLLARWHKAKQLIRAYNQTETTNQDELNRILDELLGSRGKSVWITAPFFVDYGENIHLGDGVEINMNCVFLDCNIITVGNNSGIGPNVQIYAVGHPVNPEERLSRSEDGSFSFWKGCTAPVTIGCNVWIGGSSVILPGVTIGDNTTIGAGSIVTNSIPANCLAVGNPCRVIKML